MSHALMHLSNDVATRKACIKYFNVRSLLHKIDNLRLIIVFKPGVICVVESWLDDSIEDVEISV
jgi:hypothetical protein